MQNRRHRGVVFLFFLTFGRRVSYSGMIYFSTWGMCSNRNCPKTRRNLHTLQNSGLITYIHLSKWVCTIREVTRTIFHFEICSKFQLDIIEICLSMFCEILYKKFSFIKNIYKIKKMSVYYMIYFIMIMYIYAYVALGKSSWVLHASRL